MDFEFLREIRVQELERIARDLPAGAKILEIGSGAGWQAKQLASYGHEVEGIDVVGNYINYDYRDVRVWDVKIYDGKHIPFPEGTFDVVFSSNVLEHIPHVESFQREVNRVLKDEGLCIHVMPSASWRFWSSLTYYWVRIKGLFRSGKGKSAPGTDTEVAKVSLLRKLLPLRHGERGNVISELYLFSAYAWKSLFKKTGWKVVRIDKNRLFYTGEMALGRRLSLRARKKLSGILGSSCNIFYLEKR